MCPSSQMRPPNASSAINQKYFISGLLPTALAHGSGASQCLSDRSHASAGAGPHPCHRGPILTRQETRRDKKVSGSSSGKEASSVLSGRIRQLPEAYRETLIMRLVLELTGPEIAEHTGMTHGSVRINLHRGMKLLREALSEEAV